MNTYTDYSALNSVIVLVPLAIFVFLTIPIWICPYYLCKLIKKIFKGTRSGIKRIYNGIRGKKGKSNGK